MITPEHISRVTRLYKLILKSHRGLTEDLRIMGNSYARNEFKRHKNCEMSVAETFLKEWKDYVQDMAEQLEKKELAKKKKVGKPLNPETLNDLNDEQLVQLYELHRAARGINSDRATNTPTQKTAADGKTE